MAKRFLIVGAGFFGAVCARELTDAGHHCLILERRDHIGGNCYTVYEPEAHCHRHVYGPHIFHTDKEEVWNYIRRFSVFNHFVNRPKVNYKGRLYSFPINLFTLYQIFGVSTPATAEALLEKIRIPAADPNNMEEWCLSQIGRELYETFIEGYSQKQWNRHPKELPAEIIRRLPIRLTFDDNYFTHPYQGIPVDGYTTLFERILKGIPMEIGVDFLLDKEYWLRDYDLVIYTGALDEFFSYSLDPLEYRSLRFESELLDMPDFQGNAIVNYTDAAVPFTRIVEHKHFDLSPQARKTVITREFPHGWSPGVLPYYPVNTTENRSRFQQYKQLAIREAPRVRFGGRLGEYRYFDMDDVIETALKTSREILHTVS